MKAEGEPGRPGSGPWSALAGAVLLRHGATDLNREGRVQGWIDVDLSDEGVRQARRARGLLRSMGPRPPEVWSSDLLRARRTAAIAVPGVPVRTDPRLRELDFGAWDGRLWDELFASDRADVRAWARDPVRVAPPGGETLAVLRGRLHSWAASLGDRGPGRSTAPPPSRAHPTEGPAPPPPPPPPPAPAPPPPPPPPPAPRRTMVIVAHGGPIRLLMARFLSFPCVWTLEARLGVPPGALVRLGPEA